MPVPRLLAVIFLLVGSAVGCTRLSGYPPSLAPTVDDVRAKRMECTSQMRLPEPGQLVGCMRSSGDTALFLYRDLSGRVIAVGRRLSLSAAAVPATFDSIASAYSAEFGAGLTWCEVPATEFWRVREARWAFDGWQHSLRQAVPTSGSSGGPTLTVVSHRGAVDCSVSFGLPFFDRHSRQ